MLQKETVPNIDMPLNKKSNNKYTTTNKFIINILVMWTTDNQFHHLFDNIRNQAEKQTGWTHWFLTISSPCAETDCIGVFKDVLVSQ